MVNKRIKEVPTYIFKIYFPSFNWCVYKLKKLMTMADTSYYLMNNTLEHVYLEDSYVLSIQTDEENNFITFLLEIVLLEVYVTGSHGGYN